MSTDDKEQFQTPLEIIRSLFPRDPGAGIPPLTGFAKYYRTLRHAPMRSYGSSLCDDCQEELERDAMAMRLIRKYQIEIYWNDDNTCQVISLTIDGSRTDLDHPIAHDPTTLILDFCKDHGLMNDADIIPIEQAMHNDVTE